MFEPSTSTRFFFDNLSSAAQGLLTVLDDAVLDDSSYTFGSLSAKQVFESGLLLTGRISRIVGKLEEVPGAVRHDE